MFVWSSDTCHGPELFESNTCCRLYKTCTSTWGILPSFHVTDKFDRYLACTTPFSPSWNTWRVPANAGMHAKPSWLHGYETLKTVLLVLVHVRYEIILRRRANLIGLCPRPGWLRCLVWDCRWSTARCYKWFLLGFGFGFGCDFGFGFESFRFVSFRRVSFIFMWFSNVDSFHRLWCWSSIDVRVGSVFGAMFSHLRTDEFRHYISQRLNNTDRIGSKW